MQSISSNILAQRVQEANMMLSKQQSDSNDTPRDFNFVPDIFQGDLSNKVKNRKFTKNKSKKS